MNTDSTCQLCDTCDRHLHFLTRSKNQVTELINDDNDVWHELMALFWVQFVSEELLVIFLYISNTSRLQQVVTLIHQHTKTFQCLYNLLNVCDDWFIFILLNSCHERFGYRRVNTEFYLLWVNQYNL